MLDYRIKTFLTVCETLNFTQAASQLHITQPAVSQHIKYLEEFYNCSLLTFEGKKCVVTPHGQELLNMLHTMTNDIKHFKAKASQETFPINFGTTLTIGEFVIPEPLSRLIHEDSKFDITMKVDNTQNILLALDRGEIDFAIVEGFFSKERYDFLHYRKEPFIGIASNLSHLTNNNYSYEELLDEILLVREQGSGTREIIENELKQHQIALTDFKQKIELGNLNTIKQLVAKNLGISFIYECAVKKEINEGKLKAIPLGEEVISHDFTFIWRKDSHFKSEYQQIFNILLENETHL